MSDELERAVARLRSSGATMRRVLKPKPDYSQAIGILRTQLGFEFDGRAITHDDHGHVRPDTHNYALMRSLCAAIRELRRAR